MIREAKEAEGTLFNDLVTTLEWTLRFWTNFSLGLVQRCLIKCVNFMAHTLEWILRFGGLRETYGSNPGKRPEFGP